MKKVVLVLLLLLSMASLCSANPTMRLEATHVVKEGETLDSIAKAYMTKDREIREFKEGIVEMNYEMIFEKRIDKRVRHGDKLIIGYWI